MRILVLEGGFWESSNSSSSTKLHGIINGIDLDIWGPYDDKFIPVHFTSEIGQYLLGTRVEIGSTRYARLVLESLTTWSSITQQPKSLEKRRPCSVST